MNAVSFHHSTRAAWFRAFAKAPRVASRAAGESPPDDRAPPNQMRLIAPIVRLREPWHRVQFAPHTNFRAPRPSARHRVEKSCSLAEKSKPLAHWLAASVPPKKMPRSAVQLPLRHKARPS